MASCLDAEDADVESESLVELNFAQVMAEEQELIRCKREQRAAQAPGGESRGPRFALAFSGGGIRAAAFQAGVLWRLAQAGYLQEIEYFSAVSGGAYIAAAFASHICAQAPPQKGDSLDKWYRAVVAKTIRRMQDNAGDFVRDPSKVRQPTKGNDSGLLPRVFDLPLLLLTFAFTIIIVPLELLIIYVVPITEGLYLFFGAALRLAICSESKRVTWKILSDWSPFGYLVVLFEVCVIATFVVWLLSSLPPFQLGEKGKDGRYRCRGYLWTQGALAFLMRFAVTLLVLGAFIFLVPNMQMFSYGEAMRTISNHTSGGFCMQYMSMGGQAIMRPGAEFGCANFHRGRMWFRDTDLQVPVPSTFVPVELRHLREFDGGVDAAASVVKQTRSVISFIFSGLTLLLVLAMVLVPFFPDAFLALLWVTGPLVTFVLVAILLQYRIFGPLTGQPFIYDWFPFENSSWDFFVSICLLSTLVVVPFYSDLRRFWHWFYLRSLRINFFATGTDRPFPEVGTNPYCPMMLFTGTVSDFKRLGDQETICEISFSPLHTGSDVTGYLRTPRFRTLAKCTALTGAGCLDAITLSIQNHLRFRFWLEMLNLSWGDYILFVRRESRAFLRIAELAGERFERPTLWILHRLPTLSLWILVYSLVWASWFLSGSTTANQCSISKGFMAAAGILVVAIFGLSFFGFNDRLSWLLFSPIIRQMHQATQFFFQGDKPPPLLYVTDGGVKDCTSIVQLIRRRCERILLVLAAADPNDELSVLRAAMEVVVAERLGCFFDPNDPRRDVRMLLEEYRLNPEQRYLHLGIRFGWSGETEEATLGTLIIVKNRLPPSLSDMYVRPLLTEEELVADAPAASGAGTGGTNDLEKEWQQMRTTDLGGLGCCDCCHRQGCNCGMKFPHLTGANYLWLTPRLYSCLCRLGHELSEEAVQKIMQ